MTGASLRECAPERTLLRSTELPCDPRAFVGSNIGKAVKILSLRRVVKKKLPLFISGWETL